MVEEERSPALRRRSPSPRHILRNGGLADVDTELEELSMDAGSAPQSNAHPTFEPSSTSRELAVALALSVVPGQRRGSGDAVHFGTEGSPSFFDAYQLARRELIV